MCSEDGLSESGVEPQTSPVMEGGLASMGVLLGLTYRSVVRCF